MAASVVHEDLAHELRRDCEEMRAAFPELGRLEWSYAGRFLTLARKYQHDAVAIDALGGLVANRFTPPEAAEAAEILIQLFHTMMPHLAEECWAALGHRTLVAQAPWPQIEPALLVEDTIDLPVQVNGRKRADVTIARDAKNAEIEAAVLALDAVKRALEGKSPKKIIIVPQRIVNVVV